MEVAVLQPGAAVAVHEPLIECVPNFSEGRDATVVREIVRSMEMPGVRLLDWSMDPDHNRSVVTIAGPPAAVVEAAVRAVGMAAARVDLTRQDGVHPRLGAADVVPFVPVSGYTLEQCAALAHYAGAEIWQRFGVPCYFYAKAAKRQDRVRLEQVRRGQFEGLREAVRIDPDRCPDVGDCQLHRTAGASILGAREYLVAYNIYLATADLQAAQSIARAVRASGGGLPGVKAMGVMVEGRAQVSMNITDLRAASVSQVHAAVECLAHAASVGMAEGELIGLIPQSAYQSEAAGNNVPKWARQIPGFCVEDRVLEHRLQHPLQWQNVHS